METNNAVLTPLERRRIAHDLHARSATVTTVEDLGPQLRRITFTLEEGAAPVPFVPLAVGAHVKVAFPDPRTGSLNLPRVVDGRRQSDPDAPRPVLRDYTVRAVPDEQHVVLEFVIHGSGVASNWAAQAAAGQHLGILGPRGSAVEPDTAQRYVVLADESALPAVARWLSESPVTTAIDVAVHISAEEARIDLPSHPRATISWLTGGEDALAEHLRALTPTPGDYVWAAGEAGSMLQVRRAAKELGLGAKGDVQPSAVQVDGYWRRGVAGRDHHAPLEE